MATVTLATLRARAQVHADMDQTGAGANSFVATSVWNAWLNASCAELYDLLTHSFQDYYTTSSAFSTVANTETITLPADFYKLVGVDLKDPSNAYTYALKPYTMTERNHWRNMLGGGFYKPRYHIRQGLLSLLPIPTDVRTGTLWYVPQMPALVGDSDAFDGINGWEEYAVVDAAIKALRKEESDVSALYQAKQELRGRIVAMAADRDAGTPGRIADVYEED